MANSKIPKLQPSKSGTIKIGSKIYTYGPHQLASKQGKSGREVIAEMQRLAKKGVTVVK